MEEFWMARSEICHRLRVAEMKLETARLRLELAHAKQDYMSFARLEEAILQKQQNIVYLTQQLTYFTAPQPKRMEPDVSGGNTEPHASGGKKEAPQTSKNEDPAAADPAAANPAAADPAAADPVADPVAADPAAADSAAESALEPPTDLPTDLPIDLPIDLPTDLSTGRSAERAVAVPTIITACGMAEFYTAATGGSIENVRQIFNIGICMIFGKSSLQAFNVMEIE